MTKKDGQKSWSGGAFIGVGVAVGSSLGSLAAVFTGDWRWMPLALSVCVGFGALIALAAGTTGRSDS